MIFLLDISQFISLAVEMLTLSHWIDLTRTDQIKKSPPRFIVSKGNGKRANKPKKGGKNLGTGVGYAKRRY